MAQGAVDTLRRALLPVELADAELREKPAAAVMVLLRDGPAGIEVLLGQRSSREGDPWSGHMGLPGGRHEPRDGSILGTALRETQEEVGIDLTGCAEVLGHMVPRAPANRPGLLVVPYVALASGPVEPRSGPEMARTSWCPLASLPASRTTAVVPTELGDLAVPAFVHGGDVIWGFTFRIIEELLVLLGLSGPAAASGPSAPV